MKKLVVTLGALLALSFGSTGWGQSVFTKYGPVAGIQKSTGATYQNTAAASSDIIGLWTGCTGANFLRGDGTCNTPAATTPAGSNTQVQYNNSGAFGASADFTWDQTNKVLQFNATNSTTTILRPATNAAGAGRSIQIGGGTSTGGNGIGGGVSIQAGFGNGTGQGGPVTITAGDSGVTGTNNAGDVTISGGRGQTPGPAFGGNVILNGGTVLADGNGGGITFTGAPGVGTNRSGGGVTANLGAATGTGTPGIFSILGGKGAVIGAPTGGAQGVGTLNATGLFINGVAVSAGGSGTVTNVATGTGLTGGPITTTGTLSVDQSSSLTWTGTETFSTNQTMFSTAASSFNPIGMCANGLATLNRCWSWRIGGGADLILAAADNSGVPGTGIVLDAVRSSAAITNVHLGNTTDNPVVTLDGGRLNVTGATGTGITCTNGSGGTNGAAFCLSNNTTGGHTMWSMAISPSAGAGNELGLIIDGGTTSNSTDVLFRVDGGGVSSALQVNGDGIPKIQGTRIMGNLSWTANYVGNGGVGLGSVVGIGGFVACADIPGSAVGASSSTSFSVGTLPVDARPAHPQWVQLPPLAEDNGVIGGFTFTAQVQTNGTIVFAKNNSSTGWTASGQKGVTTDLTICYFLN